MMNDNIKIEIPNIGKCKNVLTNGDSTKEMLTDLPEGNYMTWFVREGNNLKTFIVFQIEDKSITFELK